MTHIAKHFKRTSWILLTACSLLCGSEGLAQDVYFKAGETFTLRATSAVLVGEAVRHTLYVEGERIAH